MTKMIKMSLIAAVAVTGMTSTVCAQPLEDAIKGVDVSGMLRYRFDDKKIVNGADAQASEYTMKIATKAKVNDMVTANVQVEALGVNGVAASGLETAHATNDATGDRDVNIAVTKANFAANLGFATVVAGKQSVPSPFVDNAADDSTRGTGAVALIPVAGMTVAAGHFMNFQHAAETSVTATDTLASSAGKNYGNSIDAAALIGSVAGVNFDAWYVKVNGNAVAENASNITADTVGTSLGAKTTIANINLDARYSKVTRTGSADSSLTKIVASTKVGPVSVVAGYAVTPKNNVDSTIDGDNDAVSGFKVWQAATNALNDSKTYLVGAGMDIMPGLNLDVKYASADAYSSATEDKTITELLSGVTYTMSKNFSVHARYSVLKTKYTGATASSEADRGRLEVKYTF